CGLNMRSEPGAGVAAAFFGAITAWLDACSGCCSLVAPPPLDGPAVVAAIAPPVAINAPSSPKATPLITDRFIFCNSFAVVLHKEDDGFAPKRSWVVRMLA